jgi:hypothetical protein
MEFANFVELKLHCFNDAFQEEPATEIARILRDAADRIERGDVFDTLVLRDINGNPVGEVKIT